MILPKMVESGKIYVLFSFTVFHRTIALSCRKRLRREDVVVRHSHGVRS